MVRSLVGVMVDYARGKRTYNEIKTALENKDRKDISPLAPAKGLIFEKAYYPINFKEIAQFL
jgi:tRNA U38,U39,U40 pseudouridine synthase TruA